MLRLMATALRQLLVGCAEPLDVATVGKIQGDLGPALSRLETIVDEARRERVHFSSDPDLKPLLSTMRRLRHDLVIIRPRGAAGEAARWLSREAIVVDRGGGQ